MSDFNPEIKTILYGVKTLTKVEIYPLSVADQLKMTEVIGEILNKVSSVDFAEKEDVAVVQYMISVIKDNLKEILGYVLPDNKEIPFEDLTNSQLMNIVNIIFEVNYEGLIKNLKDLSKKAKTLWTSEGSSPKSSKKQVTN